jgi:hypothetical protein
MQQSLPSAKMQQSFAALSPAAQAEVTSIMTEHSHQFANVSSLRKFQQENDYGSAMVAL